ncbi:MAG: DF family (seleno)protein [Gaiellaceae bacterium]
MSWPRVEILFFEGCPNYEEARALVERVAAELELQPAIDMIEVSDASSARELRFLGSPTVRVGGRDVEPGAEARGDFALSCRVYRGERGLSGQPDAGWVRRALVGSAT